MHINTTLRTRLRILPALAMLALCLSSGAAQAPATTGLAVSDHLEPGERLTARLTVANEGSSPVHWHAVYSLQSAHEVYAVAPPHPDFGRDLALGAKSWSVADDKTIEEGSLTDGKDYTDGTTPWMNDHFTEAFQYVDLGASQTIAHIDYLAGDANHIWKVDLAVSADGREYRPIPELQNFDMYKRWGVVALPIKQPLPARFIRLRYHTDGEKEPVMRFPCRLSVYGGLEGEKFDLPRVGEAVAEGTVSVDTAPGAGGSTEIKIDRPLTSGLYLLAIRLESGKRRQLLYKHVLVLPTRIAKVSPESRFGINAANGAWAPDLRRLGVGWVRFENLKWPFVTPRPGAYAFDGSVKPWQVNVDGILSGYNKEGISVLPFLFMLTEDASSAPPGVKGDRKPFYPPKDPALFANFAFQTAARYGARHLPASQLKTADGRSGLGLLRTYEIWNEPNLTDPGWGPWVGTAAQYFDLLRAASEAVKRADPAARVTNAGWAGITIKTVDQLRSHTYPDGRRPLDFIDILNVHMYTGRVPPEIATDDFNANQSSESTVEEDLKRLVKWRDKNKPGMPIWLSETGYDSAGPYGTDERTQAARLPRVVMIALASGMDKVFVYRESGSTASMHAASGVMRDDGSYKPSFLTYGTLIRELEGVTAGARKLPYPDRNVRLYAWKQGAKTILSAWTIEGKAHLGLNLGKATVVDAFGHRESADLTTGMALTEYPVYIRDVSRTEPLQALGDKLVADEAAERARRARLAHVNAYLYKFGGTIDGVTADIGRPRPYTAVLGSERLTEGATFGFDREIVGTDERKWMKSDLDRTVVKVLPRQEFHFHVRAGRYRLRLGVSPYDNGTVTLKGALGGDRTIPAAKGEVIVQADIEASDAVLSVSVDQYALFRWLTLIERLPD